MRNPLFSIIIPVYKVEQYLKQCVDSILLQDYSDYELLLIDDGSPDNSGLICDGYALKDNRVRVLHKNNGGASSARNLGLKNAKGQYIIFVDSDDFWEGKNFLFQLTSRIKSKQEDIILFGCKTLYEDGRTVTSRGNYDIVFIEQHPKNEVIRYLVNNKKMPGAPWVMAVRRDIIGTLRFPQGVTAEDYYWIVNLLYKCNSIGAINSEAYRYRKRDGSVTSSVKLSGLEGMFLAINDWLNKKDYSEHKGICKYLGQIFFISLISYSKLPKKERNLIEKQVLKSGEILKTNGIGATASLYNFLGPYLCGKIANVLYGIMKSN